MHIYMIIIIYFLAIVLY